MSTEVSLLRLYLLRGLYLLIAVGMGSIIWPQLIHHDKVWDIMHGVASCMLGALTALAVIGVRYPLQMLPLMLFELAWKAIWIVVVAVPLWLSHSMDADTWETAKACLMGVVVPLIIPWRYVWETYVLKRGDRWSKAYPTRSRMDT